jgi:hypothetical protein
VVFKEGCVPEWEVCPGWEYYNNTRLFHRDKGQEQVRRVEGLVPGNIGIRIPGYWNGKNEG